MTACLHVSRCLAAQDLKNIFFSSSPLYHIIYQAVERHLLPNVDVSGMSRSVLGRKAWTAASASERQQFSNAFTQLVTALAWNQTKADGFVTGQCQLVLSYYFKWGVWGLQKKLNVNRNERKLNKKRKKKKILVQQGNGRRGGMQLPVQKSS